MAGFRKRATKEARRLQAKIRRETMAELRSKIRANKTQRREAIRAVRRQCRASRVRTRGRVKAFRVSERQRIRETVQSMRDAARAQCKARLARVRELGGRKVDQARREKLAREKLEQELSRIEGRVRRTDKPARGRGREHREESDDEVRGNLSDELVPVFNRIKRSVRGNPRLSRTESFLQWAEENPEEVVHIQAFEAEAETARLIRQLREMEREKAQANDDEPPPF
jgi:hypothetical protein